MSLAVVKLNLLEFKHVLNSSIYGSGNVSNSTFLNSAMY